MRIPFRSKFKFILWPLFFLVLGFTLTQSAQAQTYTCELKFHDGEAYCGYTEGGQCPTPYIPENTFGCSQFTGDWILCENETHYCVSDPTAPTPPPNCATFSSPPTYTCGLTYYTECNTSPIDSGDDGGGLVCCCGGPTPTPAPSCLSYNSPSQSCHCGTEFYACDYIGGSSKDAFDCPNACCCLPESPPPTPPNVADACSVYSSECSCVCASSIQECVVDYNGTATNFSDATCPYCCCHSCSFTNFPLVPTIPPDCTYWTNAGCPSGYNAHCEPEYPGLCCANDQLCPADSTLDPATYPCVYMPSSLDCPDDWPTRCSSSYSDNVCCTTAEACEEELPEWTFENYCSHEGDARGGIATALGCIPLDSKEMTGWFLGRAIPAGGVVFFVTFLYAALRLMNSQGDPEKIQKAQQLIMSTITGLLIIILSLFLLLLLGKEILLLPGF